MDFELPEPYAVKVSCTVLAGESGSNAADLLSYLKQWKTKVEQSSSLVSKSLPIVALPLFNICYSTDKLQIFYCFTGLAFVDVSNLKKEHIVLDNEGTYWIRKSREKTENMCDILLLDIPLEIIRRYENHRMCKSKGILPLCAIRR